MFINVWPTVSHLLYLQVYRQMSHHRAKFAKILANYSQSAMFTQNTGTHTPSPQVHIHRLRSPRRPDERAELRQEEQLRERPAGNRRLPGGRERVHREQPGEGDLAQS